MTTTQPTGEEYEPWEEKLPKRAQQKLALLRQQLADERRTSAALRGDIEETDTLIRYYDIKPDQLLEPGSNISFLPDLARPNTVISCKMDDGQLFVHGEGRGDLIIRPRSSNGVNIEMGN